VDAQLRANPQDLTTLLRAGRLSPLRVALAAYLGDQRALATGGEPWERAGDELGRWTWPARYVLQHADLSQRERVWLGAACAQRAVQEHSPEPELLAFLEAVRAWCCGDLRKPPTLTPSSGQVDYDDPRHKVRQALRHLRSAMRGERVPTAIGWVASASVYAFEVERRARQRAGWAAVWVRVTGRSSEPPPGALSRDEEAWQARAIADVLLDPAWPGWEA
jgi:hypothetical protein